MSHTKEPWFVAEQPWDDRGTAIYGNRTLKIGPPNDPHGARLITDCSVTMEWEDGEPNPAVEDRANAERIVACVNAFKGLNPDALGELLTAARELVMQFAHDPFCDKGFRDSKRILWDCTCATGRIRSALVKLERRPLG